MRMRRVTRVLFVGVALAAAIVVAVAAGLAWLLGTEEGLRVAAARAMSASRGRLVIEEPHGALAGSVDIARLAYEGDGFRAELRGIVARADLLAALGGRVALGPLRAQSLQITLRESEAPKRGAAVLGFGVRIADAEIGELAVVRGGDRYALRAVRIEQASVAPGSPPAISGGASFEVADAAGKIDLAGSLEELRASVHLEGRGAILNVRAVVRPAERQPLRSLEARAESIDLARLDAALPRTAIEMTLNCAVAGKDALRGRFTAHNARSGALDRGLLPVSRVEGRFATSDYSELRLEALRIALAGGGRLEGEAHATAQRVNALLQASGVDLRAMRSDLRPTALRGPLEVSLRRDSQTVDGSLSQEGMSLDARVVRHGDRIEVRRLRAAAAGGEVRGWGHLDTRDKLPFRAELELSRFDPASFGDYPRGSLSGKASVAGQWGGERDIRVQWSIAQSTLNGLPLESRGGARIAGRRVSEARIESRLGGSRASVHGAFGRPGDDLVWSLNAPRLAELDPRLEGRLRASGVLSGSWAQPQGRFDAVAEGLRIGDAPRLDAASARLSGSLARHEMAIAARGRDVDLLAELRGGWGAQGWAGELRSAMNRGAYPLRLAAPAAFTFSREHFQLGRFEALLGEGRLLVEDLRWAPGAFASRGEFRGLPAHWLILALGAIRQVDGDLALDGEWSIAAAPRADGVFRLRRAGGDLRLLGESAVALGLSDATIDARFAKSRVALRAGAASRFGTLELDGEITPAAGASGLGLDAASALALQGRIDFADVRVLSRALLADGRVDGKLTAALAATGTLGEPSLRGELRGDALALELPPYGVFLRNGELRASLQGDRIEIESFRIGGGEGQFTARGSVPLRFAEGNARLFWIASRFTVLDRPELQLVATGSGDAYFDGKKLALSGDLRADRGRIEIARERLPKLSDDVQVVGADRPAARKRGPIPVKLDVRLDLGDNLEIRAQGLEGKLTGSLRFATSEDGELRAWGRIETLNATFFAYGQKLQVDPGILVFDGPIDNPSLQVTAWRRNLPVEAGVQVSGTARAPRLQVVSQPPVPEGERISWLVLGRPPSDATKADLGMLQAAAGALLARGDAMPLDRRIARAFGVDEITLRGTGEAQDRVVAVGKRLSDRFYVSYEQGIGTVASNLVKMDYSLSRRWSLRAETGTSSGGGVFYRYSWD